jgi:hypothetical protein
MASFEVAIGGLFMLLSCIPGLRMGKRGQGGPATPIFRVLFFLAGAVIAVDGIIKLSGGRGIEIQL